MMAVSANEVLSGTIDARELVAKVGRSREA